MSAMGVDYSRGTAHGLVWLVQVCEATTHEPYRRQYPYRVEGRIIDCGVDRGLFGWHVASLTDPAYVLAGGVSDPYAVAVCRYCGKPLAYIGVDQDNSPEAMRVKCWGRMVDH